MDEATRRSLARWPDVPDAYGWLALDARGEWRLRNPVSGVMERIGNLALRECIARNYCADSRGAWFFQNGPQRVFVRLERTPLVFRLQAGAMIDHCGCPAGALRGAWLDERGTLLLAGNRGVGVLDDRDLGLACACIVDADGAPLEEWSLAGLLEGDGVTAAFFTWRGARISLERIAAADIASCFGFLAEPGP